MAQYRSTLLPVPERDAAEDLHRARLAQALNRLIAGLTVKGTVTLTAGTTATVVSDPRLGVESVVGLTPTTATAAAETPYVTVASGQLTITHANAATLDRTFMYWALTV